MCQTENGPEVTVLIITYNQEDFIRETLESALGQATVFPFSVVVFDDCSSDATARIVQEVASNTGVDVEVYSRPENLGVVGNFIDAYHRMKSPYVAVLAGDDVWIRSDKLQLQYDALRLNPTWSMCFTAALAVWEGLLLPRREIWPKEFPVRPLRVEDVLRGYPSVPSSVMIRRDLLPVLPQWMLTLSMEDWPMACLLAEKGEVGGVDAVTTKYRIHSSAFWNSRRQSEKLPDILDFYDAINCHFKGRYAVLIEEIRRERELRLANTIDEVRNSCTYRAGAVLLSPLLLMYRGYQRLFNSSFR